MNRLTHEQLSYVLQFNHVEKILAYLPAVKDSYIAGMWSIKPATYRGIKRHFAAQARKAAEELLREPGFAELLKRLPFRRGQTVVALGDSITDDCQSWIEILGYLLALSRPKDNINVVNQGISGNTTTEMISRFLNIVPLKPNWIICMAGTNDARLHGKCPTKTLVSARETEKNFAMLRNFATTQTRARWVWMTPPTVIERNIASHWFLGPMQLAWQNKDVAAVAGAVRRRGGEVVDIHKIFGNPPNPDWLLADGLHPSLEGQKAIVKALVEHMAQV